MTTKKNNNVGVNDNHHDEGVVINNNHKHTKNESPLVHLLAGSLAGVIADGFTHPVDTIRARLQTQRTAGASGVGYSGF